ncbi:hypothetical protein [Synechococcus sp. MIT S9507]|uniref:hypothetical protein n=1 Tax=Synechococcus sp. MIT S9507 TaxID=3082544 RepID=UPI0039B5C31C
MPKSHSGLPLISLIFGLIGGSAAAAVISYFSTSSIEEKKFSYSLIQQALEAKSPSDRRNRLSFIMSLDLILDKTLKDTLEEKLEDAQENPETLPQLPPPVGGLERAPEGVYPQAFAIVGSSNTEAGAKQTAKQFFEFKELCEPRVYFLRKNSYVVQLGGNLTPEQAEQCKDKALNSFPSSGAYVFQSRSARQETGRVKLP